MFDFGGLCGVGYPAGNPAGLAGSGGPVPFASYWRSSGIEGNNTAATISRCVITGSGPNEYSETGGGIKGCDGLIENCLVFGNTAFYGGGLYDCDGDIVNCTIADNFAVESGWQLYACDGTVTNCIIWDSGSDQISTSTATVTYSCWPGGTSGTGNINDDPEFVGDGDYHLVYNSSCIDAGTDTGGLASIDLAGNTRVVDAYDVGDGVVDVDMGAFEFVTTLPGISVIVSPTDEQTGVTLDQDLSWTVGSETTKHDVYFGTGETAVTNATTSSDEYVDRRTGTTYDPGTMEYGTEYFWRIDEVGPGGITKGTVWSFTTEKLDHCFVDGTKSVSGNGSEWSEAFKTIQEALDVVDDNGLIWVADETYSLSSFLWIASGSENIKIYGGFAGNEDPATFDLAQRNFVTNETIMDRGNANNSSCIILDRSAEFDGFTVKNSGSSTQYGTGIDCWGSNTVKIRNCIITNNGTGIDMDSSSNLEISNCAINSNGYYEYGRYTGGGISLEASDCVITDCSFNSNIASAIYIPDSTVTGTRTISNCVFNSNLNGRNSAGQGAAIYSKLKQPLTIKNCIFDGNIALEGGALYLYDSGPDLYNCLFVNNGNSNTEGGAIFFTYDNTSMTSEVANCTFSKNNGSKGGAIYSKYYNSVSISMKNSIFWDNNAVTAGHEFYCTSSRNYISNYIKLYSCDIQSNKANWKYEDTTNKAYVSLMGSDNICADPLFKNPNDIDGIDNNLRTPDDGFSLLNATSGCYNGGETIYISTPPYYLDEDITNGDRNKNGSFDIGAYELGN